MDRILILMSATEYADAQGAIDSARSAAAHPEALSLGLSLEVLPDEESCQALQDAGTFFDCPMVDLWADMDRFWAGESYVLMAHPAMRFAPGWDKALVKELRACPSGPVMTCALTGYLPVREDPLSAVCPVAADAFNEAGELTFQHGMPLRFTTLPARGPFLHPDFCFAPAGFFRAVAEGDEPLFMRAFRAGWELYTPINPRISLLWDVPVAPVRIPASHDQQEAFASLFGVSFASGILSAQSRRGLLSEKIDDRRRVPLRLKLQESWRQWKFNLHQKYQKRKARLEPKCVTHFHAAMTDETLYWFRQLAAMKNLHLAAYVEPLLKRHIAEFLPEVYDFLPHHGMELPGCTPDALAPLSKAAILSAARDKFLSPSHLVWMDPDCVRYPLYHGAFLDWEAICTDRIVIGMVGGVPDTSILAVPERMVLGLATDMHARALAILRQRGQLPSEAELWSLVIRENPDWFSLVVLPVRGQLFNRICRA